MEAGRNHLHQIQDAISEIEGYIRSAKLLSLVAEKDHGVIRSAVMVLSFGVEKSFKALIRHVEDRVPPRGHKLDVLYNELTPQTRGELIFATNAKPRHIQWALSNNSNSFEDWRYAEERGEQMYFSMPEVMIEIMEFAVFRLKHQVEGHAPQEMDETA